MNRVILLGNTVVEPEIKTYGSGERMAKIRLAVNGVRETQFFDCVCFYEKTVDVIEKYVNKGKKVLIEGELKDDSYKNRDGVLIKSLVVVFSRIELLGGSKDKDE